MAGPERDPTERPRLVLRIAALGALAFSTATVAQYFLPVAMFCEPGGGCDRVREWAFSYPVFGIPLGMALPILGVMGFSTLFVGSLVAHRRTAQLTAMLAVAAAVGAATLLVLQASTIGAWCWLCVGVDGFALLAGAAGLALFATARRADPTTREARFRSPWWAGGVVAVFAPFAWAFTIPDPNVPPVIHALYRSDAVNVVEIADFECPYCRALHPVLRSALEDVEGNVNLVRVIVPLSFHPHARDAARAYHCAVRVERGEAMADALFRERDVSREGTIVIARDLEIDVARFEQCLDDPMIEERIRADERLAELSNNQGLPTVYIGERTLLGFDPAAGGAPIRDAVAAARRGDGGRVRLWPLSVVALIAIAAFLIGRRRR